MEKEKMIQEAIKRGGKRWQKGTMDRIYFTAETLGLECTFYKSGNVSSATFNGRDISNSKAGWLRYGKTYIDVEKWEAKGDFPELQNALQELMDEIK